MNEVDVLVQIAGEDVLAGRLWTHRRRQTESQTFRYDPDYLARAGAYPLDPALPLVEGSQQTPDGRVSFGAFSDCAPDRWGRRLIDRAETRRADRLGVTAGSFGESDYLLGVRDDLRQGALRFRDREGEVFLAQEDAGVPALIDLPRLLRAAEHLERDEASEEELAMLLRGGSSLGGARPKAHTRDNAGRPAIAKFPSESDDWDVISWEAVALELARAAGIRIPRSQLQHIAGKAVLIVDRFDRSDAEGQQDRIGYCSALTMLERTNGDQGDYLEIAEVIESNSPHASADLAELWRRMAFSILISNTDDHLRNHGFLRTSTAGWALSPAFDLNPDPSHGLKRLSTLIDGDPTASIERLIAVADLFRLSTDEARGVLGEVSAATDAWQQVAQDLGVDRAAANELGSAFEHEAAADARSLSL